MQDELELKQTTSHKEDKEVAEPVEFPPSLKHKRKISKLNNESNVPQPTKYTPPEEFNGNIDPDEQLQQLMKGVCPNCGNCGKANFENSKAVAQSMVF